MENLNKAVLYLAVIGTMIEALQGMEVDQSELVDSLAMLGFDPTEIMYNTKTLTAFQQVCRGFSELDDLTEDDILAISQV